MPPRFGWPRSLTRDSTDHERVRGRRTVSITWRRALAWATGATLAILALDVGVRVSAGMAAKAALLAAVWWLTLWPILFLTIWGLVNWRRINRRVEELRVELAVRAAASEPSSPASALCGKCGYPNPSIALKCANCGIQLRTIEVMHTWEQLPGALESGPAVFYVVAVILSFFLGAGAVALVALASPRLIDNGIVMVGTFLSAALLTLVGAVEMMRRYVARRQMQWPRGRRTRS